MPAPSVMSAQFGSAGPSAAESAVNLFRGDVNLTQTLLDLPGPSDQLPLSLAIQYQSNVALNAATWNLDAPTGILGLGWSFPLTYIARADVASPVPSAQQYTLYDNGTPNPIYRQTYAPLLFTTTEVTLQDGAQLPADLRNQFLAIGLPLSASAKTQANGSNWVVQDDALEQMYDLRTVDGGYEVRDGGELYQAQNYTFGKIIYYPLYERWVIVGVKGVRRSLGGLAHAGKNLSIGWTVWSANGDGQAVSKYAAGTTNSQVQMASTWYLSQTHDRFGNWVKLAYTQETRVVGSGLSFSKAVYLRHVADSVGTNVTLNYSGKTDDTKDTDGIREYADPHQQTPDLSATKYQDPYETQFLESIVARSGKSTIMTLGFRYATSNPTVPSNGTALYGDTFKRLLLGITQTGPDGISMPEQTFVYDSPIDGKNDGSPAAQPGAMYSVTTPQGGTTQYNYTTSTLKVDRSIPVDPPNSTVQPQVFFGDDYAVTTYANQQSSGFWFTVSTWVGGWRTWKFNGDGKIATGTVNVDSIQVQAAESFITISYLDHSNTLQVYVFQRDLTRPGQWLAPTIHLNDGSSVTIAQDTPLTAVDNASFYPGAAFFAVLDPTARQLTTYTYSWIDASFSEQAPISIGAAAQVAAGADFVATVTTNGAVSVHVLSDTYSWSNPVTTTLGIHSAPLSSLFVTAGQAMIAVSRMTSQDASVHFDAFVVAWDTDFNQEVQSWTANWAKASQDGSLDLVPVVVDDALVGIGGIAWRRHDGDWLSSVDLAHKSIGGDRRYAYGRDVAVLLAQTSGDASYLAIGYDPTIDTPWTTSGTHTPSNISDGLFPSVAGTDWVVIGRDIFYRNQSTNWADVIDAGTSMSLDSSVSPPSIADQGPDFISGSVLTGTPGVRNTLLRNGAILSDKAEFSGQKVGGFGPGMLMTFTGSNLASSSQIMFTRYAAGGLTGPVTHYTVAKVTQNDGIAPAVETTILPDMDNSGCDTSGNVAKFYSVDVYPGTTDYGKIVRTYYNGMAQVYSGDDYLFEQLDGMLATTDVYAEGAQSPIQTTQTEYNVYQQIASDPTASAHVVQLHGAIVLPKQTTLVKDGVTTLTTFGYISAAGKYPYNGQRHVTKRSQAVGSGTDIFYRETLFAADEVVESGTQNNASIAIGAIGDVVQVNDHAVPHDAVDVVVRQVTNTYAGYLSAWDLDSGTVTTPAQEAQFSLLSTPQLAFPFASYQPGDAPTGYRVTSRITDRLPTGQPIRTVDGTNHVTTSAYDANAHLQLGTVASADTGQWVRLGFQSYEDATNNCSEGVSFDEKVAYSGAQSAKVPQNEQITASFQAQNQPTVVALRYRTDAAGATLTATLTPSDGSDNVVRTITCVDTKGGWIYASQGFPKKKGTVSIVVANPNSDPLYVDSVLGAPLHSAVAFTTYDPQTNQVLSTQDLGGRTQRTAYNAAGEAAVTISPADQVQNITIAGLGQSTSSGIGTAVPNSVVSLQAAGGGVLETFRDGGNWANRWTASTGWTVANGEISSSGSADTLTWAGDPQPGTSALYVEPKGNLTINLGDLQLVFDGTHYTNNKGWTAVGTPKGAARQWLLTFGQDRVLFFVGGVLVYSEAFTPSSPTLQLQGQVTLRNLTVANNVRLGVSYADGGLRTLQVHQLTAGHTLTRGLLYDDVSREIATTRIAPPAGEAAVYDPNFASLSGTTMQGTVATHYNSEQPYWGTEYEASVRQRRNGVLQPQPSSAAVLTLATGDNSGQQAASLTQPTSSGNTVGTITRDVIGQVAQIHYQGTDGSSCASTATRSYRNSLTAPPTTQLQVQLPGAGGRLITADAMQQVIGYQDDDTGPTDLIYDNAGRVRFALPAMDTGESYILYSKYDSLGRETERGRLTTDLTAADLAQYANTAGWPSNGRVSLTTAYDSDGSKASSLGLKHKTIAHAYDPNTPDNATPTYTVTEYITYDSAGNVKEVNQEIKGAISQEAIIYYTYDALGEVTCIKPPPSVSSPIYYTYNDLGQVAYIGTSPGGSEIGSYTYTDDGQVYTENRGDWSATYGYSPTGWVTSIDASSGSEHLNLGMQYDQDGSLLHKATDSSIDGLTAANDYGYNGLRRVTSDSDTNYGYDDNGNITSAGGDAMPIASPSNRLASYTPSGGSKEIPTYTARGQLTSGAGRTFEYDPATLMPISVTQGQNTVSLVYGGSHQRVVKVDPNNLSGATVYYHGAGKTPVMIKRDGEWQVIVQGPTGIAALLSNGETSFPLADAMGSVMAMGTASGGVSGSVRYGTYGEVLHASGHVPFRYQGKEWDSEIGVYNFSARLFDPTLRRFSSPDPQRQLASPYAFAAGDPLGVADPTGELGVWARVGIGVGLGVAMVAGAVLTGGVADAAIVAGAAGEAVAGTMGEYVATMAAEAAGDLVVGAADAAVEGSAEGAITTDAVVETGVSAAEDEAETSPARKIAGKTIIGGAKAGLKYDRTHGSDFSAGGFAKAVGIGAAKGLAGAVTEEFTDKATEKIDKAENLSNATKWFAKGAVNVTVNVVTNDVQQVAVNLMNHDSWYHGLAKSTGAGIFSGLQSTGAAAFPDAAEAYKAIPPPIQNTLHKQAVNMITASLKPMYQQVGNVRAALMLPRLLM